MNWPLTLHIIAIVCAVGGVCCLFAAMDDPRDRPIWIGATVALTVIGALCAGAGSW